MSNDLDDDVDWVIALRLLNHEDPGRTPTEAEIRLVVWFLLDQGYNVPDIARRTGLSKTDVTRIYDLRRLATCGPRPGRNGRTPDQAYKMRPHWYYVMLLGGAYARERQVNKVPVLVGVAS